MDIFDINAVQGLLLFNIGENEVSAGELKSHGYYQGSNVSYNLKKLVDIGYMHHQRCRIDRRAVRVGLTQSGRNIRDIIARLFARHAQDLIESNALEAQSVMDISHILNVLSGIGKIKSAIFIDPVAPQLGAALNMILLQQRRIWFRHFAG